MSSLVILIFLSLCMGVAAWLFFLSSVRSGQYDDVEGIKYRILDDEEDEESDSLDGTQTHEYRRADPGD